MINEQSDKVIHQLLCHFQQPNLGVVFICWPYCGDIVNRTAK